MLFDATILLPLLAVRLLFLFSLLGFRLGFVVRLLLLHLNFAPQVFFMVEVLLSLHSLLMHSLLLAHLSLLIVFIVTFFLCEDVCGPFPGLFDFAYRLEV